jgi:hypothetical protein
VEIVDRIREACAEVAAVARHVHIVSDRLSDYLDTLKTDEARVQPSTGEHFLAGTRTERAAYFLTLDSINFGSGWFPTLRHAPGRSGYYTIALALKQRFETAGPWSADELSTLTQRQIAETLGQDPDHELMGLYAKALRALGGHIGNEYSGDFVAFVESSGSSALRLVETLAGWESFRDVSSYRGRTVPFFKRAQITASDLAGAGVAAYDDLDRLTLFADNLVPHVLRVDGVLVYEDALLRRIESGELLEHGSEEEVEIRACAVHAVELLAAAVAVPPRTLDYILWNRGQQAEYKALPRHRTRSTAY